MSLFLGFDTSNYTTSVAAYDGEKIYNERQLLEVKKGERGLRQSDAVFAHMKAMPSLFEKLMASIDRTKIKGIGVSTRPRNVDGSYMPVFLAGVGYAKITAKSFNVPLYEYSHQEGHIMAGIVSGGCEHLLEKDFLSVHLSGGTSEILKSRYCGSGFNSLIIGGTKDISAGQLIDRIGVKLGMSFPCGKEMEKTAEPGKGKFNIKTSVKEGYANFSGAETAFLREIENYSREEISYGVLKHIGEALAKMINNSVKSTGIKDILIVGGVASNSIIRNILNEKAGANLYYGSGALSTDNAVGVAALARKAAL